jgi:hypothetical protein
MTWFLGLPTGLISQLTGVEEHIHPDQGLSDGLELILDLRSVIPAKRARSISAEMEPQKLGVWPSMSDVGRPRCLYLSTDLVL